MSRDEIRENIISKSIHLFMKYGLRSVTMDDIAKHLGMSKKTIYQHFKDKEEIIIEATKSVFDDETKIMEEIESNAENAVDHLYKLTVILRERIKATSSTSMYDMRKYYPKAWEKYMRFKQNVVYNSVINNLRRGIKEGLFREEINPEILSKFRIAQIEHSFDSEIFSEEKFSLVEIHEQLFEHFTYGILSQNGIKLFETYKQNNKINEIV